MAAGSTYTPIATTTLGSSAASYTFSSIPSTYTDLVIILNGQTSASVDVGLQFNGDTATNYSRTYLEGDGTTATSGRSTSQTVATMNNNGYPILASYSWNAIYQIMNYANATTYKSVLGRSNNANNGANTTVALWRSTAAINSVLIKTSSGTFSTGSTFTLYGIAAA